MWGDIVIAFLLAFITAYVVTPYTIRFSKKIGALDLPKSKRKIHKNAMPRLRWTCCNCRLYIVYNLFNICNVNRKNNFTCRIRKLFTKINWFLCWFSCFRDLLLYRWLEGNPSICKTYWASYCSYYCNL